MRLPPPPRSAPATVGRGGRATGQVKPSTAERDPGAWRSEVTYRPPTNRPAARNTRVRAFQHMKLSAYVGRSSKAGEKQRRATVQDMP